MSGKRSSLLRDADGNPFDTNALKTYTDDNGVVIKLEKEEEEEDPYKPSAEEMQAMLDIDLDTIEAASDASVVEVSNGNGKRTSPNSPHAQSSSKQMKPAAQVVSAEKRARKKKPPAGLMSMYIPDGLDIRLFFPHKRPDLEKQEKWLAEARKERLIDIDWHPDRLKRLAWTDEEKKAPTTKLNKDSHVQNRNEKVGHRLRVIRAKILLYADDMSRRYPTLTLHNARFWYEKVRDYARFIETFPQIFDIMSVEAVFDHVPDCNTEDARFLNRVARYTPNKILVRVIADIERETYAFVTEFDKYNDVFFKKGGKEVGFLD